MIVEAERLIDQPRESLNVEIKSWVDLDSPKQIAKIIKTLLALRNHNGGFMIFGFNDEDLEQITDGAPDNTCEIYHPDKIQSWVTKYSSNPFEIQLYYPEKNGIKHPIIQVPSGFKTIVTAKSDLEDSGNKLVRANIVYVRTLSANNSVSTAQATWKDWDTLVERCFDNREADIGNFLRRHLGGLSGEEVVTKVADAVAQQHPGRREMPLNPLSASEVSSEANASEIKGRFLSASFARYDATVNERNIVLPEHGYWACSLIINGEVPNEHRANREFLQKLNAHNPNYTGWPVWLDSSGFSVPEDRPRVFDKVWEALIVDLDSGSWLRHVDFLRFDPAGRFFIRRALQDDICKTEKHLEPMKSLDFGLSILRTAETIAVGLEFARALGCEPDKTSLSYTFVWDRLSGRTLSSWANPNRYLWENRKAYQDQVEIEVVVPLNTPNSRISEYTKTVIDDLFEVFEGFAIAPKVIEDLTSQLLSRNL